MKREEVWFIVEYLSCGTDPEQITEVLDILMSLCERASKSKMAKRLSGIHVNGRTVKKNNCRQVEVSLLRRGSKGFFSGRRKLQSDECRRRIGEGRRICTHLTQRISVMNVKTSSREPTSTFLLLRTIFKLDRQQYYKINIKGEIYVTYGSWKE